jgi:hypothetical protein
MQELNSEHIRAVHYEPETRKLQIAFRKGGVYEYSDVPQMVYDGLVLAESASEFFRTTIKGVFDYERLE